MTNRDYIMNISVKDFINEYCLQVGYTEKDFVRLMILFKADDDRVNEWLDSEMIGGRKLTNAERIKSRSIEELTYFLAVKFSKNVMIVLLICIALVTVVAKEQLRNGLKVRCWTMREILFRGKDSITKSWVYGALVQQQDDPLKEKAFIISYSNYQFGDFQKRLCMKLTLKLLVSVLGLVIRTATRYLKAISSVWTIGYHHVCR